MIKRKEQMSFCPLRVILELKTHLVLIHYWFFLQNLISMFWFIEVEERFTNTAGWGRGREIERNRRKKKGGWTERTRKGGIAP